MIRFLPALLLSTIACGSACVLAPPPLLEITDKMLVLGRAMGLRSAERIDALSFILGQADATAGINTAFAKANNSGAAVVDLPCGTYTISGPLMINITGLGSVKLHGAGSGCTIIKQIGDADGIDANISNYGSNFLGGGFHADGFTLLMAAPDSTAHTALKVITSATTGSTGVPIELDDIIVSSPLSVSTWAVGVDLSDVSNIGYLSHISTISNSLKGTSIRISGSAKSYSTSIYMRDVSVIGGSIGLDLGNYLQGIHVDNLNTINTIYSVHSSPTAGINQEIQINGSYLDGHLVLDGKAGVLNSVKIANSYINSDFVETDETHVFIRNVPTIQLMGDTLNGPVKSKAHVRALEIAGNTYASDFSGIIIQAYGAGGTAITLDGDTRDLSFRGMTLVNNSNEIVDAGVGNTFSASTFEGVYFGYGTPGDLSQTTNILHGSVRVDSTFNSLGLMSAQSGLNVSGGNVNVLGLANNVALEGSRAGLPPRIIVFGSDINTSLYVELPGSGALVSSGPLQSQHYIFAKLPSDHTQGRYAFCNNCRKPGEAVGSGTGTLVYDDGGVWVAAAGTAAAD